MNVAGAVALGLAGLTLAAPAGAAAEGWTLADVRSVPLEYFQGLTHDAAGQRFFAGVFEGLYATDRELRERARNPQAIPAELLAAPGFDHIGDPTWDAAEGGRLLLPLECYTPGAPNGGNTCGQGAIGVADPQTLAWRYTVRLDPGDIAKATWAEVAPGGNLMWTSSGHDLLAYRTADISPASAAAGTTIRPAARLAGAVPPSGITGAVFYRGRLLLAGQATGPLQIWSVDVTGGTPTRLEVELPIAAESEGLDVLHTSAGLLHWLLSPFPPGGGPPTYGSGQSTLLAFVPRGQDRLRARVTPAVLVAGRAATVTVRVTLTVSGSSRAVSGARVRLSRTVARTDADGVARLRVRPRRPGALRVTAVKEKLRPATATLRVRDSARRSLGHFGGRALAQSRRWDQPA